MAKFINYTNHKLSNWSEEQIKAAEKYGEIIEIPFPVVAPQANTEEIEQLADSELEKIMSFEPSVVLCQGEFTLSMRIILKLKANGVKVVAATSERKVIEEDEKKIVTFKFVKFREY